MKHHDLNPLKLTEAEASALLDAELAKAPEAMDAALISNLLACLSPEAPDARHHEQLWQRIIRAYRLSQVRRTVLRFASVAAVLLLTLVFLRQSAQAFHWQFLQSIFSPASGTFQMSSSTADASLSAVQYEQASPLQLAWSRWEDIPEDLSGVPFKPAWMPAHFTFQTGSAFMDANMTKADLSFTSPTGDCTLSLMAYWGASEALVDYEKLQDAEEVRSINNYPVRIYRNDNGLVYSAFWQREHFATSVSGVLTEAELLRIVESLIR